MESKEKAFADFMDTIRKCWTYERFTDNEKSTFEKLMRKLDGAFKGTYRQRCTQMNYTYYAYLYGLGYDGPHWRDPA